MDATKPQRGAATSSAANHVKINLKETTLAGSSSGMGTTTGIGCDRPNGNIDTTLDSVSFFHLFKSFGYNFIYFELGCALITILALIGSHYLNSSLLYKNLGDFF